MLYEDKFGNLMHPDEVEALSPWEIDDLKLHVYEDIDDRQLHVYRRLNVYH